MRGLHRISNFWGLICVGRDVVKAYITIYTLNRFVWAEEYFVEAERPSAPAEVTPVYNEGGSCYLFTQKLTI